jgi:hypothetical protein
MKGAVPSRGQPGETGASDSVRTTAWNRHGRVGEQADAEEGAMTGDAAGHGSERQAGPIPGSTVHGSTPLRLVALGHGAFYLITGVWPFVSRRAFEKVTGPKTDWWLVQTVGIVVTGIGLTLLAAARRPRVPPEASLLAVSSALGLASIDVVHVARGRLRWTYLLDAAAELALIAAWLAAAAVRRRAEAAVIRPPGTRAPAP